MSDPLPEHDFRRWLQHATQSGWFTAFARPDVQERGSVERYPPRAVLLTQGDVSQRLLLIQSGEVELVYSTGSEQLMVQRLGPGSTLGDLPLLLGLRAPYTAVARTAVVVCALEIDALAALLRSDPELTFDWLRAVTIRLDRSYRRVLEMSGKSALERVAQLLVDEVDTGGLEAVALTQTQIARLLAMSRQTVSLALGELQTAGLVARRRGRVDVLDAGRLRMWAHASRDAD